MMKCPDCKKDVGFNREYCPHCSGELHRRHKNDSRSELFVAFTGVAFR